MDRGYDPGRMGRLVGARYVVPLREGGSLPAVVETDGGGTFVVKFRGAGQGPRALIAEYVFAGIAAVLGLPVPRRGGHRPGGRLRQERAGS